MRFGIAKELRDRCERLREHLSARSAGSDQDIKDLWPGGALNPKRDTLSWARCYADLSRIAGRSERPDRESVTSAEADATIIDALRGAPVIVRLSTADSDGRPRTLAVHPKGMNAICEMAARDSLLRALRLALAAVQTSDANTPTAKSADQAAALVREIAVQNAACVAIATHAGPGLPYKRADAAMWRPSESVLDLSPIDVLIVLRGYHEANSQRLAGLQQIAGPLDEEKSSLAPSWTVYLGSAAQSLGVRSEDLLENWSLAGVIASTYAANALQRAQMADAKERPVH